jgi:Septum formation initiator
MHRINKQKIFRVNVMKNKKFKLRHVICLIVLCCISYTVVKQQIMISSKRKEIQQYSDEYKEIQNQNSILKDEIEFAKTDEYKERMARERMGLIKPGETVYIFDSGN